MVNTRSQQRDSKKKTDKKRPRLRVRLPNVTQRKSLRLRQCQKVMEKAPLNICELPIEMLEKIIGNINIWHHNRIRGTSQRMKDVSDVFVMHEFKKAAHRFIRQNPNSEASAALRVYGNRIIRKATEVYVRSGFESTFCGCILPMLRSFYKDPFCPQISQVKMFLVHFYNMVTDLIGDTSSQRWQLLYTITLMRLVKAFDKLIISSNDLPLHCGIVVELKGPWLGTLWTSKGRSLNQSRHHCNLLVILSEMLIASITGRGFNDVHVPTTKLTFTIYGSKKICNLFRSCLEDEPEQFQCPSKWPKDHFTVNLEIVCKEAIKWGGSKSQHFEFGPFTEAVHGETEDEQDNCE